MLTRIITNHFYSFRSKYRSISSIFFFIELVSITDKFLSCSTSESINSFIKFRRHICIISTNILKTVIIHKLNFTISIDVTFMCSTINISKHVKIIFNRCTFFIVSRRNNLNNFNRIRNYFTFRIKYYFCFFSKSNFLNNFITINYIMNNLEITKYFTSTIIKIPIVYNLNTFSIILDEINNFTISITSTTYITSSSIFINIKTSINSAFRRNSSFIGIFFTKFIYFFFSKLITFKFIKNNNSIIYLTIKSIISLIDRNNTMFVFFKHTNRISKYYITLTNSLIKISSINTTILKSKFYIRINSISPNIINTIFNSKFSIIWSSSLILNNLRFIIYHIFYGADFRLFCNSSSSSKFIINICFCNIISTRRNIKSYNSIRSTKFVNPNFTYSFLLYSSLWNHTIIRMTS